MKWEPAVTLRLPYPVSSNRYWTSRAVRNANGKWIPITHPSTEAQKYRKEVHQHLRAAGVRKVLAWRVRVDIQLYPHCPQDWRLRQKKLGEYWDDSVQRLDLDNCRKVLNDALREIAIVDDFWIWEDSGKVMEPRSDVEACVVVRISRGIREEVQQALELREEAFP